jgi:hypothetical protein
MSEITDTSHQRTLYITIPDNTRTMKFLKVKAVPVRTGRKNRVTNEHLKS